MNASYRSLFRAAAHAALLMLFLLPLAAAAQVSDRCEPRCENGGTCIRYFDDFKCNCRPGFSGGWCQLRSGGFEPSRPVAQDFHALFLFTNVELFYQLDCAWNRQLCTWWKDKYENVFAAYHQCQGPVKMYHGNCSTPIPAAAPQP